MTNIPRRVVTGHDAEGKSTVLSDGPVPNTRAVADGAAFHEIWATKGSPASIMAREAEPTQVDPPVPPPANGSRLRIVDFPPGGSSPMHRTQSIDYGIVLTGELEMVLDDGSRTTLRTGDIVIQRGTDHTWHNASGAVTSVAFILIDAKFDRELLAVLPPDVRGRLMDEAPVE